MIFLQGLVVHTHNYNKLSDRNFEEGKVPILLQHWNRSARYGIPGMSVLQPGKIVGNLELSAL